MQLADGFPKGLTLSCSLAIEPVSRCVSLSLVSTLQEFDSVIPVDVVRVKSYVNSFLDSFGVPV